MTQIYRFNFNEFYVESEVALPNNAAADTGNGRAPRVALRVRYAPGGLREFAHLVPVADRLGGFLRTFETDVGILVCMGERVRMHVGREGTEVVLACPEHDLPDGQLLLMGHGFALCGLIHGALPLHGACADLISGRALFLAGSGTGKSTLLWEILRRGGQMVSDDLIPVYQDAKGVTVPPSGDLPSKLSREILEVWGWPQQELFLPVGRVGAKRWVPVPAERRAGDALPPSAIYLLTPGSAFGHLDDIAFEHLSGAHAVTEVQASGYGLWMSEPLVAPAVIMIRTMALLAHVPVCRLHYPKRMDVFPGLIAAIEAHLDELTTDKQAVQPSRVAS